MKIIEGKFAGQQIKYREQKGTRVTTDKVRKAVFDVLKGLIDFEGLKVADLFCGSGMYGLEAASRGADSVLFVDKDGRVINSLKEILISLGIKNQELRIMDYEKFIKSCDKKLDLIFADPPYYEFDFLKFDNIHSILNREGIFVLETSKRVKTDMLDSLELLAEKKYGDTRILIFKKQC